ncbi:MAG TPA: ABC transporter permease [Gemmataceae bacterium]|nr:ABC transporter permease [Gemmataceae bacterium]
MKVLPEARIAPAAAAARPRPSGRLNLVPLWALYVLTLRQHLHGRRWIVMGVLFLLPAGLAVLIRATAPDAPAAVVEFLLAFMFIPQALLPLVALVYATGIIQDEQEEQTLTYLLIRPIRRWAIYLVKLLATLTTTILLTAVFTVLTYAAVYVGGASEGLNVPRRCLTAVGIHGLSVATYCCLFGLIGLYTRRALVAGILYTAVIEGLLANLPFGLRFITVIYYARIMAYRSMDFTFTDHGRKVDLAAGAWQIDVRNDPGLLDQPSLQTCALVLTIAGVVLAAFGALFCARREFHVKTPEGS